MATPDDITPLATILALLPDNTSGQISAEDMRNVVSDLYAGITASLWKVDAPVTLSGLETEIISSIGVDATFVQVSFNDISINAEDWITFQAGGSVSYLDQAGDYVGRSQQVSGQDFEWDSMAGLVKADGNNNFYSGRLTLSKEDGNKWSANINMLREDSNDKIQMSAGSFDLAAQTLTRIKLLTEDGTDLFDNGTAQVSWQ